MSVTIRLNGDAVTLAPGATVADVVARLVGGGRGTAVARNGEVVPKSRWGCTDLAPGDALEVLTAAQGG